MNRRRLDAEGIRDAMLAVSGELNPKMGGPGVLAPLEKEVKDLIFTEAEVVDLWPETADPREHLRRSLYLFRKRNVRYPLFDSFDAPDTQTACPQRERSTHALQALVLLNSDFAIGRARALAGRLSASRRGPRRPDPPRLPARPRPRARGRTRSTRPAASSTSQADLLREPVRQGEPLRPADVRRPTDRPGRGRGLGRFRPGDAEPQRVRLRALNGGQPCDWMTPMSTDRSRCPGPSRAGPPAQPPRVPPRGGQRLRPARRSSYLLRARGARRRGRRTRWPRRPGHFPAKAKRCIFLFMTGGPSQMDLFDPKPLLNTLDGQPLPPSFGKIHSQFLESDPLCLGSHRKWGKYGQSGMDMSDLVPHMHQHADDIALIRSCVADSVIHAPAMYQMNTGRVFMGYPSLGSWVTYGLGSESENLPAYVVMTQPEGTPEGGAPCWGAGFLPAHLPGDALPQRARRRSST